MNASVYLFGLDRYSKREYAQYPLDYTSEMFQRYAQYLEDNALIVIHRNKDLVYHLYYKKVTNGYVGMCVLLNSAYVNSTHSLFVFFDSIFYNLIAEGFFLQISSNGEPLCVTSNIVPNNALRIEHLFELAQSCLDELNKKTLLLPPIDVTIDQGKEVSYSDFPSEKEFREIISKYSRIVISVGKEKSYHKNKFLLDKIVFFAKECDAWENRYNSLKSDFEKAEKQRKRYKLVVFMSLVILLCGVAIYYLYNVTQHTKNDLQDANYNIKNLENTLDSKNKVITSQNNTIQLQSTKIDSLESSLTFTNEKIDTIQGFQPLIFCRSRFNWSTKLWTFHYYGLISKYDSFAIRIIFPDGSIKFKTFNFDVNVGENDYEVFLGDMGSFNSNKFYCFELLYNNDRIIGGSRL